MHRRLNYLFTLSVVLYWWLNQLIPFWCDDYGYTFIYPETGMMPTHERITSFSDVIISQWHHYHTMNGRAVVHILTQCFCGLWGKWGCNILAAILFAFFFINLGRASFSTKNVFAAGFVSTLGFALLFENVVCCYSGISYILNYLWSATLCLSFYILLFRQKGYTKAQTIGLSILGFLAGWSNESFAIPLCAGIFFFLLCAKENGIRIYRIKKYLIPIIICLIGGALLIFAPANFNRAGNAAGGNYLHDNSIRLGLFAHGRIFVLFIFILFGCWILFRTKVREFCKKNRFELIAVACTAVFFLIIGVINYRATMGIDLLSWILLCRLLLTILPDKNRVFTALGLISAFLIIGFEILLIIGQMQILKDHEHLAKELATKKQHDEVIFISQQEDVILSSKLPVLTDYCNLGYIKWYYQSGVNICDGVPEIHNNPKTDVIEFTPKGEYYYTLDTICGNVELNVELGDYYLTNPLNIAKALVSFVTNKHNNRLIITSNVESFTYENQQYYRVHISSFGSNRKIKKVTLKKE